MTDILNEIIAHKRIEVEHFKATLPPSVLYPQVEQMLDVCVAGGSMRNALLSSHKGLGIIAEFKRRSPSKGWIKEEGRADRIPLAYQLNGAAAISILTDTDYFGGDDEFITVARQSGVTLPILYKNFIVDEYQLYQARRCGASAVLLIAAALTVAECRQLLVKAHSLGLEVLLEMHSDNELDYADLGPDMYGINNRNLGSFVTDINNSFRMAELLPHEGCKVSESGISNIESIRALQEVGFNGFLIGECFMKTQDPGTSLRLFTGQ